MPRQLTGSNRQTNYQNGTFENDVVFWYNSGSTLRERSTDYVFADTYAGKFREFYAGPRAFTEFVRSSGNTIEHNKKYVLKAKVYVPSGAPYAPDNYDIRIYSDYVNTNPLSGSNPIRFTIQDQTIKTISQAKNNWVDVELFVLVELHSGTYPSLTVSNLNMGSVFLTPPGAGNAYYNGAGHIYANVNGLLYIDKFELYEYVDVAATPSTLLINKPGSTITNANGPATTDGSIVVATTGGAGPFEYSKDNGATWQSSATFSGLAAGSYTIRVRETLPEYDGFYVFDTFTVGVTGAQFTFTTTVTNQQVAGANDGAIVVNVTGSGSPYNYAVKLQSDPSALSYQSGSTFSNLAPGIYEVWVKDTYQNTVNTVVTINEAIIIPPPEVCTLAFSSYSTLKASTPQTADGAIFSIAATDPVNDDYHFYEGGGSYTNVNGGFNKPWTITGGRATLGTLSHTQNSDILRQPIDLENRQYSFDWEAYFVSVSQLFYVAFYNASLVQINSLLLWDSDNQQGNQTGSFIIDAATANATAYIGYYMVNQSGANVSGNYLSFFRIHSSALPVKYNLNSDFDYSTQGQSSGNFGGLLPGSYTVYARTSDSCRATVTIAVEAEINYGVKYRYEFDPYTNIVDTSGGGGIKIVRLDILQKGYAGAITTITHGDALPVTHQWENQGGQDPFETIISSYLKFTVISKTDAQWLEFATTNEREYKAIAYQVMTPGGEGIAPVDIAHLKVLEGFLTPMLYSEPYYKKENYPVTLTFTDGLANLDNIDFSDDGGNFPEGRISMLKAIAFCLNKTGLGLNIYESVNILATGMNTAPASSMLTQAFIDPRTYLNSDGTAQSCLAVLRGVLGSLGCRLYQSMGKWNIDLITQKVATTVTVREFYYDGQPFGQPDGVYAVSGQVSLEPRMKLRRTGTPAPKIVFAEQSAMFQVAETYGTVKVNYPLQIESDPNLLDYTDFEPVDVANGQLKGFSFTTSGTGIGIGTEEYEDNKKSLYIDFDNLQAASSVTLITQPVRYYWPGEPHFVRLSFDVYTRPLFTDLPIYIDFMLRLVNSQDGVTYYLQPDTSGNFRYVDQTQTNLISGKYNRVYVTEHLNWKTITVEAYINQSSFFGELQLEINLSNNPAFDVDGITNLRAISTTGDLIRKYNNRLRVRNSLGGAGYLDDELLFYELEAGDYVHNPPDVVRPTSFNGYVWKLKKATGWPTLSNGTSAALSLLQSVLVRKVRLEYVPSSRTLESSILVTESIDLNIRPVLEKTIVHGDISALAGNYRYLTPTYISNAAGEPLTGWYRRGVTESFTLQQLLGKIIRGQYSEQRILLSGQVDTREIKPMFQNTIYELRSGRILIPLNMSIDYRAGKTQIDMIEVLKGEAVVDEGTPTLPPIEPPVSTREHSEEFATEFS